VQDRRSSQAGTNAAAVAASTITTQNASNDNKR
jgi:hypothetical protein